jgi:DNA mismatch endonuclease (patch repair protein)
MAAIKGKDTKPELLIRRSLHARGLRYRLHDRKLPGRPDLVFQKYRAVLFVNGCFWHGHDCPMFRWPQTRPKFWREKISGNISRDIRNEDALKEMGWRVGIVWECALKGPKRLTLEVVTDLISCFLNGNGEHFSIHGQLNKLEPAARRANVDDTGCSGVLRRASGFS